MKAAKAAETKEVKAAAKKDMTLGGYQGKVKLSRIASSLRVSFVRSKGHAATSTKKTASGDV